MSIFDYENELRLDPSLSICSHRKGTSHVAVLGHTIFCLYCHNNNSEHHIITTVANRGYIGEGLWAPCIRDCCALGWYNHVNEYEYVHKCCRLCPNRVIFYLVKKKKKASKSMKFIKATSTLPTCTLVQDLIVSSLIHTQYKFCKIVLSEVTIRFGFLLNVTALQVVPNTGLQFYTS